MVAHEKRNSAQLFCAVPTRNDLALSSLIFSAQPTQKLEYPLQCGYTFCSAGTPTEKNSTLPIGLAKKAHIRYNDI